MFPCSWRQPTTVKGYRTRRRGRPEPYRPQLQPLEERQLLSGFQTGAVIVSIENGKVEEHRPDGTLVQTLDDTTGSITTGSAFDAAGNFYVTDFNRPGVSKFDSAGNLVGPFGSGYSGQPESILVDKSGNFYVGAADTAVIRKFDPAGTPLAQFTVATEDRGTDWIDLAADQRTIFYTSEGTHVKRFDLSTNTQLPDFNATPLPGAIAYALRLLPGGGLLVADSDAVQRLDASGNLVQTYTPPGTVGALFALNLDPDGTSFWTGDISNGHIFRFDINSGTLLGQFTTSNGHADGLSVKGEITVGGGPPPPVSKPAIVLPTFISKEELLGSSVVDPSGDLIAQTVYVNGLYQDLLGRAPDVPGLNGWVQWLQAGVSRLEVAADIWLSAEHRDLQVNGFYTTYLHRQANRAERGPWVNALLGGMSEQQVALLFLTSAEYQGQHSSDTALVTALYQDVLGRNPDAAGQAGWQQALAAGVSRAAVAAGFLNSTEALTRSVDGYYRTFLHRAADLPGEQGFLNLLQRGILSQERVGEYVLASAEYGAAHSTL